MVHETTSRHKGRIASVVAICLVEVCFIYIAHEDLLVGLLTCIEYEYS